HAADDHRVRLRRAAARAARQGVRRERGRLGGPALARREVPGARDVIPSSRLSSSAPVFAALGDPHRIALVSRLCQKGPLSIKDLTEGAAITRQAVTKHLRVLEAAGLARSERSGRETVWTLDE